MTLTLNPRMELFIQQKIDSGNDVDAASVIEDALRLMEEPDRLDLLRASLDLADEQIERGEGIAWSPAVMDRMSAEATENSLRGRPVKSDVAP